MGRLPRLLFALGGLAAAGAVAFVVWRSWDPARPAYRVARGDLVQSVVASGRVESPRRVEIAASVTGTVVSVPVDEGQTVAAGQLLVALDDSEARAAVEQARQAVAQAQAKLAQMRATTQPVAAENTRQAEVNLGNAERQLQRSRELFSQGFIGQAALDDAQRARDVAQSQRNAAQLQEKSSAPGGADYRLAETQLEQARATLLVAEAHLELMSIEAPTAGTLIARSVERGNAVQPGRTLLVLSPAGDTQLVVEIDEKNLSLLRIGQTALASADAYPDRRFAARVAYINPGIDPSRGSVEVKLAVPDPPTYLLQDMTVSVDIEVARRNAALMLPTDAVHDLGGASPWVNVARAGRVVRQPVKLGARGEGRVEIATGLDEGELVLPATPATLAEGQRVRPKPLAAKPNARS